MGFVTITLHYNEASPVRQMETAGGVKASTQGVVSWLTERVQDWGRGPNVEA
jgi:hypothetical protein